MFKEAVKSAHIYHKHIPISYFENLTLGTVLNWCHPYDREYLSKKYKLQMEA